MQSKGRREALRLNDKLQDRLYPKKKVSVIASPFLNSLEFPVLIPDSDLQNVHPFIKNLF